MVVWSGGQQQGGLAVPNPYTPGAGVWVVNGTVQATALAAGGAADPSALLTLTSTTRGLLPPRMTTGERDAISSPAAGLVVFNTSTNKLNLFNGTGWEVVTSA